MLVTSPARARASRREWRSSCRATRLSGRPGTSSPGSNPSFRPPGPRRRPRAGPQRLPGPVINNRPRSRLQSGCTTAPSSSPFCISRRSPGRVSRRLRHCAGRHRLPFPAGRERTIPHRAHERVPPRPGQRGPPLHDQPESARANRPKARPSARHTRVVCSARRDLFSDHGDVLLLGWCSDHGRQMRPPCPRNRTSSALLCPQAAIANNDTSNTGTAFPFATQTRRCCRDRTHGTSFGGSAPCSQEATFPTALRATVAESSRVEDECASSCAHRRASGSRAHRQAARFLQRSHTNLRAGNRRDSIQTRRRLLVAP